MTAARADPHGALWDAGAQPERTYQAWSRTALGLSACSLLVTRLAGSAGSLALFLASAGIIAAMAISLTQRHRLRAGRIEPAPRAVAAMTGLTVLLAIGALGVIALGPAT